MDLRDRTAKLGAISGLMVFFNLGIASAERQMETLDRGVVAINQGDEGAFVSWRLLATDPEDIGFDVWRAQGETDLIKLNDEVITDVTYYQDREVDLNEGVAYQIRPTKGAAQGSLIFAEGDAAPFLRIPLQTPDGYSPNDASVGDLTGDGTYNIVIQQSGRGKDNSQAGFTDPPILEAYQLDGAFLWRIQLGKNIREGAHYTQFLVYDFDGDGRSEVVCKTADGTIDGKGNVIGDADADHRSKSGRPEGKILKGPEFLTVFDGQSGEALATTDYIPARSDVSDWGDNYGNRVDRFLACVAYLDGERPSIVMCRGYYTRSVLVAWDWRDGELTHRWTFDSDDGTEGNRAYRGQGNHGISVGDVDNDGKDEIIYGSCVIDDDGTGLYSTGLGHGDAMHFSDIDPNRPGLEVFKANGDGASPSGIALRDARTGEQIWGIPSTGRRGVVRACALDIDPRHLGLEMWGKGNDGGGLYNAKGERISDRSPRTCNMGAFWDGDLLRELLNGVTVTKWDYENGREAALFNGRDFGAVSINGSKANPSLCADILGDWREEILAPTRDGKALLLFTSTQPTEHRFVTFMHDPIYRLGIAWQNVSYNQPAHPGFYFGDGMETVGTP